MGREFNAPEWKGDATFASLLHEDDGPYDSVVLDRGSTGFPVPDPPVIKATVERCDKHEAGTLLSTRIEDVITGKAQGMHPGYEFVVYSWDQVLSVREVPFDRIDPPPGW